MIFIDHIKKIYDIYNNTLNTKIYEFSLLLLVISLPFSNYTLSVSMIILAINWLLDKRLAEKLKIIIHRKSILLITIVYLIHVIGLLYSSNLEYGLHDLRIKLPLLALPIIIGTSQPLDKKKLN